MIQDRKKKKKSLGENLSDKINHIQKRVCSIKVVVMKHLRIEITNPTRKCVIQSYRLIIVIHGGGGET
jgi:hypothetical protein